MFLDKSNKKTVPSSFANYFMNNVVSQIKRNSYCNNKQNYYKIDVNLIPTSGFSYCKGEAEPEWFKGLLDVLNVKDYGYMTTLNNLSSSESVYLNIDCDGKDLSNIYAIGSTFKCNLLSKEFTLKLNSVNKEKIILESTKS